MSQSTAVSVTSINSMFSCLGLSLLTLGSTGFKKKKGEKINEQNEI